VDPLVDIIMEFQQANIIMFGFLIFLCVPYLFSLLTLVQYDCIISNISYFEWTMLMCNHFTLIIDANSFSRINEIMSLDAIPGLDICLSLRKRIGN